jgi:uncharacterized membrane protein YraQ (UPF0718 family)
MTHLVIILGLWTLVAVLAGFVWRNRGVYAVKESGKFALIVGKALLPRLVFALLAASFLARLVPQEVIASMLGQDSGLIGILFASVVGGLLPGGPMTSFPVAVFMWQYGAGMPQMVALLTGWSVFAFHRIVAYEVPIMGWRFTAVRLASSLIVPPLAGLFAAATVVLLGLSGPEALSPPH